MNAYVVFVDKESANAALAANGTVVDSHHIVCDIAANSVSVLSLCAFVFDLRESGCLLRFG